MTAKKTIPHQVRDAATPQETSKINFKNIMAIEVVIEQLCYHIRNTCPSCKNVTKAILSILADNPEDHVGINILIPLAFKPATAKQKPKLRLITTKHSQQCEENRTDQKISDVTKSTSVHVLPRSRRAD